MWPFLHQPNAAISTPNLDIGRGCETASGMPGSVAEEPAVGRTKAITFTLGKLRFSEIRRVAEERTGFGFNSTSEAILSDLVRL